MQTTIITKQGVLAIIAMLLCLAAVGGYIFFQGTTEIENSTQGVVSGEVMYRERIALPPGSVVTIELQEMSVETQSVSVLAEETITTNGANVPIPFTVQYDVAAINEQSDYVLSVRIKNGEVISFATIDPYPVITKGNRETGVVVMLTQQTEVASDNTPVPPTNQSVQLIGNDFVWKYTEGDTIEDTDSPITPTGEQFVLRFSEDGQFTSTTDCNQVSGGYVQDGEVLSLGPIVTTLMACDGEDSKESVYLAELGRVTSFSITENNQLRLNLLRDSGVMVFEAATVTGDSGEVMCTMDALECPDGSFVGRVAPDCSFAACPAQ